MNPYDGFQVSILYSNLLSMTGIKLNSHTLQVSPDPRYVANVEAAIANMTDPSLQAGAAVVMQSPTFLWLDSTATFIADLKSLLTSARSAQQSDGVPRLVQIVLYDIPDRECAREFGGGDFTVANNGEPHYFDYVQKIKLIISRKNHTFHGYAKH